MGEFISIKEASRVGGLELGLMRALDILPESFDKFRQAVPTPIYDITGEPLFYRFPLYKGGTRDSFTDVAINSSVFGAPLISVSHGARWNEQEIKREAVTAAMKLKPGLKFNKIRFVAYSFPKVAVQFLSGNKEVLMLEWMTWTPVPSAEATGAKGQEYFMRWSVVEGVSATQKKKNLKAFGERLDNWSGRKAETGSAIAHLAAPVRKIVLQPLVDTRVVHYSTNNATHHTCYELHGQETGVWCVAASVQMLLEFYRYEYTQTRIAQRLHLGTLTNPNGLPYGKEGDVVSGLEFLSSKALDAAMDANPSFNLFRTEIQANRPMISFIEGHSRTVAGYTRSLFKLLNNTSFRGLLVYDPWPPNVGVITKWENFDAPPRPYRHAFTAKLTLV